jgi:SAM-dependent methyltransferase
MRAFWDARAREEPYFFIDDRRRYRDPELETFWREGERDLDRLLELLGRAVAPGDVVLEVGCGIGRLTRPLAARAGAIEPGGAGCVLALDVSAEMIDRARRHHSDLERVQWIVGDGRTLAPVPDGSVDAAVSHVVFQHIPDPAITLGYVTELGRVLRPGGWAAFQVSNNPAIHRRRHGLAERWRAARAQLGAGPRGRRDPAWLGSAVKLDELRGAAARGGLEIERIVGAGTQFCLVAAVRRP